METNVRFETILGGNETLHVSMLTTYHTYLLNLNVTDN